MTNAIQQEELFASTHLPWFTARECWLRGVHYMLVYRSAWVKETDVLYAPVAGALRDATLVASGEVLDETMMFGRAEWLIYKL